MCPLLRLVLAFGNILALTPSPIDNPKSGICRKFYSVLVLLLLSLGVFATIYFKQSYYNDFVYVKLAIALLLDAVLFLLNCWIVITSAFYQGRYWVKLIGNLRKVGRILTEKHGKYPYWMGFAVSHAIFWFINIYDSWIWFRMLGLVFVKQFLIETIQSYMLFYYQFLIYVILRKIVERYDWMIEELDNVNERTLLMSLRKIEYVSCKLKQTIGFFNAIFGWPILMIILYTSLQLLDYVDEILGTQKSGQLHSDEIFITNAAFIVMTTFGTAALIWHCDSVLIRMEKLLGSAYVLQSSFSAHVKDEKRIRKCISVLRQNYPVFTAARFFTITRETFFSIFGTIVSFLVVLIQFRLQVNQCVMEMPGNGTHSSV